jgi:hypothetical protein
MSLRAAKLNVNLYRGDDYPYQFTILNSSATPYSATGSTVVMTMRDEFDGTVLWTGTTTDGVGGSNFATGVFVFTIPNATSAAINENCVYDVQETTTTSKKNTLVYGTVFVQKDVT